MSPFPVHFLPRNLRLFVAVFLALCAVQIGGGNRSFAGQDVEPQAGGRPLQPQAVDEPNSTENPEPVITRGPYLQMATPRSMVIRWRTDIPCQSRVRIGRTSGNLNRIVHSSRLTTEHSVRVLSLVPDRQYFYSVGTRRTILASGAEYTFVTPPPNRSAQKARIWVLGDPGTGGAGQAAVRDAYNTFNNNGYTDLWLMLGDNAYESGTDAEYQSNVFDMYPDTFRQSPLWPTIGNHDTAESTDPPLTLPYFQMFTLPTRHQAGGRSSGTEKYYSFNYANVHFVCLDSQTSDRSATGPMARWLKADLAANRQKWIVAYWHHPPYSKGGYNTDSGSVATEMRQNILPLLEARDVDLVLAGHSHVYERSYLINGHHGTSDTFTTAMMKNSGDGREGGSGAYMKPSRGTPNSGTVYVVLGSSAKLSGWSDGSDAAQNPNPHPIMFTSQRQLGSVILDVEGSRMDVKFLTDSGTIGDEFTILKSVP